MPDDVQPQEGQGDGGSGIFDPYLQTVPEDARETVTSYLKDAEKNVNSRLETAARYEPYEKVELLRQYQPEELDQLLQWHQAVRTEDGYREFVANAAKELGLTPQEEQEVKDDLETGELTPEALQAELDKRLAEQLSPLQEQVQELATERAIDAEESNIRSQFDQIEAEHDVKLTKEMKEKIILLGAELQGEDWIKQGYDTYQRWAADIQKQFVETKSSQPKTAMASGGTPGWTPSTTFEEAAKRTAERFAQARQ